MILMFSKREQRLFHHFAHLQGIAYLSDPIVKTQAFASSLMAMLTDVGGDLLVIFLASSWKVLWLGVPSKML